MSTKAPAQLRKAAPQPTGPSKEELDKYVERADEEVLDWPIVRKLVGNLERKMHKNLQERDRHAGDPEKFMDSEIDLDEELHKMNVLTTVPELYYDIAHSTNFIQTLLSLLSHENTDISSSVLALLSELTDPEILSEDKTERAMTIVEVLGKHSVLQHVLTALLRLDFTSLEDADSIIAGLAIIDNIQEIDENIVQQDESSYKLLVKWILRLLAWSPPSEITFPLFKLNASELLSVLMHNNQSLQNSFGTYLVHKNGQDISTCDSSETFNSIHTLLKCLSVYRKKDDLIPEEIEYAENIFNSLCQALLHKPNRELFLKADGIQLMVILIKRRKLKKDAKNKTKRTMLSELNRVMRICSIRLLSHSLQDQPNGCQTLVDSNGLGSVFGILMLRPKVGDEVNTEVPGYVLSVLNYLLMYLNDERRSRLMRKFIENDFEKTERIVELYVKFHQKLKTTIPPLPHNATSDDKVEYYLEQLTNGLFELQQCSAILASICVRSKKIFERATAQLKLNGQTIQSVRNILHEYANAASEGDEIQRKYLLRVYNEFQSEEDQQRDKEQQETKRSARLAHDFDDPIPEENDNTDPVQDDTDTEDDDDDGPKDRNNRNAQDTIPNPEPTETTSNSEEPTIESETSLKRKEQSQDTSKLPPTKKKR